MSDDQKARIRSMIDAFVEDDNEQVELDFHNVVTSKVRDLMGIESASEVDDEGEEEEVETDEEEVDA